MTASRNWLPGVGLLSLLLLSGGCSPIEEARMLKPDYLHYAGSDPQRQADVAAFDEVTNRTFALETIEPSWSRLRSWYVPALEADPAVDDFAKQQRRGIVDRMDAGIAQATGRQPSSFQQPTPPYTSPPPQESPRPSGPSESEAAALKRENDLLREKVERLQRESEPIPRSPPPDALRQPGTTERPPVSVVDPPEPAPYVPPNNTSSPTARPATVPTGRP